MNNIYIHILPWVIGGFFIFILPYLFEKNGGNYRIFKGLNYSGIWFLKMFFKKQEPFQALVTFDESCEVETLGVQKIFGIGDLLHHKNSDRYGFIYEGDKRYGIYSYQYKDGSIIPWVKLGTVETGEPFFITFPEDITSKYEIGRYLYPYFEQDGDDEKGVPHTMKMNIEFFELKSIYYDKEQVFELDKSL